MRFIVIVQVFVFIYIFFGPDILDKIYLISGKNEKYNLVYNVLMYALYRTTA